MFPAIKPDSPFLILLPQVRIILFSIPESILPLLTLATMD